ncbi:MAG: alpha/beta hydrolase [Conexivisphaerales archaeon]
MRSGEVLVEGNRIYYEEGGDGIPILFLEGLGYSTWMWFRQVEGLSSRYRCILVDNRGVGKSSRLSAPYTVEQFARDAVSVLEALNVDGAFLVGVSMGGFIAQSIASIYGSRVRGIVLISTSCGGKYSLPMPKETWDELVKTQQGEDERSRIERVMKLAFTDSFPKNRGEEFDRIIDMRIKSPQDRQQWLFQAMSSAGFDAHESDMRMQQPALIIAGMKDRVLPWQNSLYLYKAIPNSSLVLFSGQNHLLFIEEYQKVNSLIDSFIEETLNGTFVSKVEVI